MYMYKTSILWSVWEGEHLGVSTFLTNYIKCTQGWIFYLFGFFFRTTPCSALDFWTWKRTTSFTNTQVTELLSTQRRCWACVAAVALPAPSSGHSWGKAGPKELRSLLKTVRPAWTWWLGQLEAFPAASRSRPTKPLPWSAPSERYLSLNFQGESSYLMGSIIFLWKSVWNIPGLEWCRKLWQNIWTMFSSLDISVLPEI